MRRKTSSTSTDTISKPKLGLFWILVSISFVALVWYRVLFHFPVWFDEIIAKAFLFGLPALVYMFVTKQSITQFGMNPKRFWFGAYIGLALGGSFGFLAMFASTLRNGHILVPNLLFATGFWWAFFLAFATAWWESLFFYGFILTVLKKAYGRNEWRAAFTATGLFLLFHAPILLIHGTVSSAVLSLVLLGFFAFGQAVMYLRYKSVISMIVSHAFWGMALLVYTLR